MKKWLQEHKLESVEGALQLLGVETLEHLSVIDQEVSILSHLGFANSRHRRTLELICSRPPKVCAWQ